MKKYTRKIMALILIVCLTGLCGCGEQKDELFANYKKDTAIVKTDIGEYIDGQKAELITEGKICYVTPDMLGTDENLSNKATLVINITDNQFVFGSNIFNSIYPASVTKLLTCLIIMKYANLEDEYVVKEDNCGITEPGAQLMGFKKGDRIKVSDLIYCLLLYSGNDAAYALSDYYSGDERTFCSLMNEEALKLGCSKTHFVNSHGLHDDNHFTTAYDMYIVLRECLEYELFRKVSALTDYQFNYTREDGSVQTMTVSTTNRFKKGMYALPSGVTIIGGKTGNTYSAGACLIQCIQNSEGKEFIIGVFGARNYDSLYHQMQYLINKQVKPEERIEVEGFAA